MPSSNDKKPPTGRGGWWFLAGVVLLYLLLALTTPDYARASFQHFVHMGLDLLPVLGLVFLFMWLLNLGQGTNDKLGRLAGRQSGLRGWLLAVVGGILSHGPVYAWYPLLRDLQQKGARPALLAAFLYARSIKLPWLPLMASYFGLAYTLIVCAYIVLFAMANGWLVEKLLDGQKAVPAGD